MPMTAASGAATAVIGMVEHIDLAMIVGIVVPLVVGAATVYYKGKASRLRERDIARLQAESDLFAELQHAENRRREAEHEMRLKMMQAGVPVVDGHTQYPEYSVIGHPTPLTEYDTDGVPLERSK